MSDVLEIVRRAPKDGRAAEALHHIADEIAVAITTATDFYDDYEWTKEKAIDYLMERLENIEKIVAAVWSEEP